jgi:hypothetical protein
MAPAFASDVGHPDANMASKLYPGKTYSPYAQRNFPDEVFWGETHLHTSLSMDAGLMGATLGHEEAYQLARGEEVISSTGLPVKLARPLDWLVISDHSDLMGFANDLKAGAPNVLADPKGAYWYGEIEKGGEAALIATLDLVTNWGAGTLPEKLVNDYSPGSDAYSAIWKHTTSTADEYNDPGKFTTLIGYEWTSMPDGNNLHRNVIFRDGAEVAAQMMPMTTQEPLGSTDEVDLYDWMEKFTAKTGGQIFALAHNGNLSNGWMFPTSRTYAGGKVDKDYVTARAKWELLYEVTQIKGDGEAHPSLSPNDEFADFGTWDVGNLSLTAAKEPGMVQREYAREALKQGFVLEEKFGVNPFKFGMVGATDAHTGLSAVEEDNFFSKSSSIEPNPHRVFHPFVETDVGAYEGPTIQAGAYQGVWAKENTREAIWDAMARKETYASTGPRIMVRLFGGYDFNDDDLRNRVPAHIGYRKGVPMGGDLAPSDGKAPNFMVYALRDPIGANLDRIQIVKGWMDAKGDLHEKVYDVVWSGDRQPGADGKLPSVGNTVDEEAATWSNTIGAPELATIWTDPDFDSGEKAFYYARILEIPTPRWVLYDKLRFGIELPEGTQTIHQERAYTSPIWYSP